ncbi:hypothetical protein AB4Z27_26070 [Cupriavidus sp. KB_39]|uniref:hypothetical protein n=1 Tax=Cupriavidus sp. KB_39 TaxID=3233036 RepID=UPI003F91DF5F
MSERHGREYWLPVKHVPDARAWLSSVQNIVRITAPVDSHFGDQFTKIMQEDSLRSGVPANTLDSAVGLLRSLLEEMQGGLLRRAEYYFIASAFDDFLDHAEHFQKRGKKMEAGVLASAVFEDAIRKTAEKHQVKQAGVNVDPIIDELVKKGVLTLVKAKRWRAYAGIRNSALHAQWNDFELRDVADLIRGTREIIDDL